MNESKPYPDEVCSNTDELDLPSWCVETPDFTVDVIGQLCLEVCFLFLLFFGLHQWFRHRRDKRVGLERLKQLEHQPSVKGVLCPIKSIRSFISQRVFGKRQTLK